MLKEKEVMRSNLAMIRTFQARERDHELFSVYFGYMGYWGVHDFRFRISIPKETCQSKECVFMPLKQFKL